MLLTIIINYLQWYGREKIEYGRVFLIGVYGNRNMGEGLPLIFPIDSIELIDPRLVRRLVRRLLVSDRRPCSGLEAESHATAHRARRLHQINRASVLAHHGHIPLRQKISQVHENFHVSGEKGARNRLPYAEVQVDRKSTRL